MDTPISIACTHTRVLRVLEVAVFLKHVLGKASRHVI